MESGKLYTWIFLLAGMLFAPLTILASENVVIVKGGTYKIDDRNQLIDDGTFIATTFEKNTSIIAVEFDHVFDNGFSLGGGYQGFDMDYNSAVGAGDFHADFALFNGKIYFTKNRFKPFIGFSAGLIWADFNGNITGGSLGVAIAGMAGFRWQYGAAGLYVEYKNFISADTADGDSDEVDLTGETITGGISISF